MINLPLKHQAKQAVLLISLCILLVSCVRPPVFKDKDYALIKSSYPFVAINGNEIEKTYQLDLESGKNTVTVLYNTYHYDYYCTFSWLVSAGTVYEVVDQENEYPLTLYRWHRKNSLWAIRLDPVDPLECSSKPLL